MLTEGERLDRAEKRAERAESLRDAAEKRLRQMVGDLEIAKLYRSAAEARDTQSKYWLESKCQRQRDRIKQLEKENGELLSSIKELTAPPTTAAPEDDIPF